ncbi:MBL fold metallo-hydrolase [Corynebacterium sp. sy039]|uniref:MBL fold metallo-hydrolase n=1 Tax=Corynebacterium sp. sy039 TaxID=2599641 RepID=UPI0011B7A168|nr:MBL fold metallo-hydrolase [Corynebacterium sp. sy039]QDZ42692.1 MBL fold metallo-hydrolase [Corynebacterium sp. sy039]
MNILHFATGPYATNCYIAVSDGIADVIDPGMHSASAINDYLSENNLALGNIILTHGHIDHVRDAGELAHHHGASVYIHKADAFMLNEQIGFNEQARILFDVTSMRLVHNPQWLEPGSTIAIAGQDFTVHHCPGHSPGSVILQGKKLAFSGDVLFEGSVGRTDLPFSSPEEMTKTLKDIVLSLPDDLAILPGHGAHTTMRVERKSNPFLQELS